MNQRAVMGIIGWLSTAMAARYQHMVDPVRKDIVKRIGGLIWQASAEADAESAEQPENGPGEGQENPS